MFSCSNPPIFLCWYSARNKCYLYWHCLPASLPARVLSALSDWLPVGPNLFAVRAELWVFSQWTEWWWPPANHLLPSLSSQQNNSDGLLCLHITAQVRKMRFAGPAPLLSLSSVYSSQLCPHFVSCLGIFFLSEGELTISPLKSRAHESQAVRIIVR